MFTLTSMPSTTSVILTYTTFAAGAMLARSVINEVQTLTSQFIPQKLRDKIIAALGGLFGTLPNSQMTLIIDGIIGISMNEIYRASEIYLSTRITPSIEQLKVSRSPSQNNFVVTINIGEKLIDEFEGIKLRWEFCCTETRKSEIDYEDYSSSTEVTEHRSMQLSFPKRYREKILSTYLPYVVDRSKAIQERNKVVKLPMCSETSLQAIVQVPGARSSLIIHLLLTHWQWSQSLRRT